MYKKYFFIVGLVLIVLGMGGALYQPILIQCAKFLVFENYLGERVQAGIVLSGDARGFRIQKAVEIYKQGKIGNLIMGGGGQYYRFNEAHVMADFAIEQGVNPEDIIIESNAESTYENAVFALPIVKEKKLKNLLIITSRFHTRRSYFIFRKVFKGSGVKLYVIGSPDQVDYQNWWRAHESADRVLIEWAKTIVYWFKY